MENNEEPRLDLQETFIEFLRPYGTSAILIANIALFAILELSGGPTIDNLIRFGARYSPAIWNGEYWRFFSAIFLHADIWHLLVNCACLLVIGRSMETGLRTPNFLTVYLISGLTGGLLSDALNNNLAVGASGAIYGLLGSGLILNIIAAGGFRKALNLPSTQILFIFILVEQLMAFRAPMSDNIAHLGGLLGGTITTIYLARRTFRKPWRRRLAWGTGICGFILLAGVTAWAVAPNFDATRLAKKAFLYAKSSPDAPYDRKAAFDFVQRALTLEPANTLALHVLALCQARGDKDTELKPIIERSVRAVETREARLLQDGSASFALGCYSNAITAIIKGCRSDAISAFNRLLKLAPEDSIALACRGIARTYADEELEEAEKDLLTVQEDNPYRNQAEYALIHVYNRLKQKEKARALVEKTSTGDPFFWNILLEDYHHNKASGDIASASKSFKKLEDFCNVFFDAAQRNNQLAYLYAECDIRLYKALDLATEASQIGSVASIIDTLGWVYYRIGDYDSALHHLRDAANRSADGVIRYHLAETLMKHPSRNFKEAAQEYRYAIQSGQLSIHEYHQAKTGLADALTASVSM